MADRTLPHNLDAERSVLGAILAHNDALYVVAPILTPAHFFRMAHGLIYAALIRLTERGIASDFITVREELQTRGELENAGGVSYLASLTDGVPHATNVEYYARIVKEKATLRSLIETAGRVITSAYEAEDDATTVIDDAERVFLELSHEAVPGEVVFADQLASEAMTLLTQIDAEKRPVTGLSTGFPTLDGYTRGMHKGNLLVLGGRPGEGKSSLALQIALSVSRTEPVALFSMEMNREEITTRAIAMLARVDHHRMMLGALKADEQTRVGQAVADLGTRHLGIDDSAALTPFQIRSKARRLKARRGLSLVVVDYLQLLQRPKGSHSREEAVADNSRALKVLAGDLAVPVLALSQLNRGVEGRADKKPTMADLRESGAIEQDANAVFLLYRPPPASNGAVSVTPPVELIIAKQRNGPQQVSVELVFVGEHMRFEECERWRQA